MGRIEESEKVTNFVNKNEYLDMKNESITPRKLKILRIVGFVYLLLAIAFVASPYDFDEVGWLGYVDDFFLFMSAFTFLNGAFQKAERAFLRRQFFMLSVMFFVLCLVWIAVLVAIK